MRIPHLVLPSLRGVLTAVSPSWSWPAVRRASANAAVPSPTSEVGTSDTVPSSWVMRSTRTPYSVCRCSGVSVCVGGAVGQHASLLQQDHAIADLPGELQIVRGDEQRQSALVGETPQQLRDLDLVVQVEGCRRLVEDQQSRSSSWLSSSNWASALAITTRCFSPPLSVSKWRHSRFGRPGGGQRPTHRQQVRGASRIRRGRDGRSVPSARDPARCSRRPGESPAAPPPAFARARAWAGSRSAHRRGARSPVVGASAPDRMRSSVVLPDPFGPSTPVMPPRATCE